MNKSIQKIAIYPAIGIARLGNAPVFNDDDYFLGPELSDHFPIPENGFKDEQGRIRKQAAKFRLYAYDQAGKVVQEITYGEDIEKIEWRVHLANRKSAWYQFHNALDLPGDQPIPGEFRNKNISSRSSLVIDAGVVRIAGTSQKGKSEYQLDKGRCMTIPVNLGEVRTDPQGRLIVLGGDGHSGSFSNKTADTFANNETWFDNISDGTVRATITLKSGETIEAEPAMVAVTPPNYGPGLYGMITMYDVVYDMFVREKGVTPPPTPDFYEHIYPIFERLSQTQWVNHGFYTVFGKNSPADFTDPNIIERLKDKTNQEFKNIIFKWFRDPENTEVVTPSLVPPFYGDAFNEFMDAANVDLSVTRTQYKWLKQWSEGNYTINEQKGYTRIEDLPLDEQPHTLTKAHLDDCLGGPFHPGIELTWPMRLPIMWEDNFRLKIIQENEKVKDDWGEKLTSDTATSEKGPNSVSGPGTLTRWLGVPWQTDEASCLSGYDVTTYLPLPSFWAARVPNQVLSLKAYKRITASGDVKDAQRLKHFDYRQDWLRDFGTLYQTKINNMINKWHHLGIIAPVDLPHHHSTDFPSKMWIETGRGIDLMDPLFGLDPSFDQVVYAENIGTEDAVQSDAEAVYFTLATELPKNQIHQGEEVAEIRKSRVIPRDQR